MESIRHSVGALPAVSEVAAAELAAVAELALADVMRVARLTEPAQGVAVGNPQLGYALLEIGAEMARVLDDARGQVAAVVGAEASRVEALLRPAVAPALPRLADIRAVTGSVEWAGAVAERYPWLTAEEVLAIHHYTTANGVTEMNDHLRHPERTPADLRPVLDLLVRNAISGLAKLPRRPGITFRGTYLPTHVLPRWQPGTRVADRGFLSTSSDAAVAEHFRQDGNALVTVVGWRGVDVGPLSCYSREAEVLFAPGTQFRIRSRRWNDDLRCWNFRIEEVIPR